MRKLSLLIILAATLAVPAVADGATTHVVRGAGWGHGIGLSQYGAYGYALKRTGYRRILGHYYRGAQLTSAPSRPVRVLLQPVDPYIRFRGVSAVGRSRTRPAATYVARASRGRIVVRNTRGKLVGRYGSRLRIQRAGHPVRLLGPALNGVRDGRYRGAIEMLVDGGGLTAINVLPIDPYVKGVVPGEMPASWPAEALKAQAVVARSYALATRKSGGAFDQYPDTRSQVYRGVNGESPMSSAAVDATAGQILAYGGRPAVTYYFSTSGGHTESVENVFIGSLSRPWLVGVPDPYDDLSPHHRWRARFSTAGMTRALRGHVRGSFRKIKVLRRGRSPRIVRARIYGTRGTSEISGPALRSELGLRDTWAYFSRVSSKATRTRAAQALHALVPVRPSPWRAKPRSTDLSGSFEPAPRGRRILIERRVGHSWRLAGRVRTSRAGRYRASVARAGVYRVRAGSVAGPSVRVR